MRRYILKRIILAIIILFGVSIIVFFAARLTGDATYVYAQADSTEEELEIIRARFGLDKPLPVQYYIFIKDAVTGDFGESLRYGQPAMSLVLDRVPATLQLGSVAFLTALTVGILFGTISATRRGSVLDWGGKFFAMLGQSMPIFWTGIMLILLFGVNLHLLPTSGRGGIQYMIMPVISMAWYSIAAIMRMTRSSMLDVMDTEYIKLARLKGNPERTVIWKHALRNALIPVIGLAGMQLANLLGGQVIIETIFRWPGVGSLMIDAINNRDYPLIQAAVLLVSSGVVTINLLVDLLFGVIDPRIRYE